MIKQSPFSLYDFLGYFIPGATLIYSYLIINKINSHNYKDIESLIKEFESVKSESLLIFIICAYITGHLLSFLSSLTIEKYSNLKYNYPSKYLLELNQKNFFKKVEYNISDQDKKKLMIKNLTINFWRIMITTFVTPLLILDLIFNVKENYTKELDPFLSEQIKYKIEKLLDNLKIDRQNFDMNEHDFHRIVLHHSFENNESHQFKMVNYVALYGFLRNICLTGIILFWIYFIKGILGINFENEIDYKMLIIIFSLGSISFISFVAFIKFYRRYTLEGLMLTLINDKLE